MAGILHHNANRSIHWKGMSGMAEWQMPSGIDGTIGARHF